ncbi:MAG: rhomboid family intramembrane serine protease [Erysipelotrichaceae bacterium]|nr:rhomboid family intramembrane serine protease [Erysipelotrichaceae bacterium]
MDRNFYKMYQLSNELITKYGFEQKLIRQYGSFIEKESWLFNPLDKDYQLIRITLDPAAEFELDRERVAEHIKYYSAAMKKDVSFLDIHITDEIYDKDAEEHPHAIINEGYADGIDLHELYPELYNAIHEVDDPNAEIKKIARNIEASRKNKGTSARVKSIPFVTYAIIGICVALYVVKLLLDKNYPESSVYVFLGADYMTFTLGLKQFYRLITTAFVHGGFLHLLSNMYTLFYVGRSCEVFYGRKYYISILLISTLCGSLTEDILSGNTISIGISGGLYGLMIFFILDLLNKKMLSLRSLVPLIVINLYVNFLSATAWKAHLGGLIAGFVLYELYRSENKKAPALLLIVLVLSLIIKYVTIKTIDPFFSGTDLGVIKILNDLGLKDYAEMIASRLNEVYKIYGG